MNRIIIIFLTFFSTIITPTLFAQEKTSISKDVKNVVQKIGIFNFRTAIFNTKLATQLDKSVSQEIQPMQKKIVDLQNKIQEMQKNISKNSDFVSDSIRKEQSRNLEKNIVSYNEISQRLRNKILEEEKTFSIALKPIVDKILKDLIKKESWDIIIDSNSAVYAKENYDLTSKITKLLDEYVTKEKYTIRDLKELSRQVLEQNNNPATQPNQ